MTQNKRLRNLLKKNNFQDSEDGLPKTEKIVAIRFYKGRAYHGKKYLFIESVNDDPKTESNPL